MGGSPQSRNEAQRTAEVRGPIAPGTVFEKYEIVRCIGLGGMGAVYEARHLRMSKRVALKTMLEGFRSNPELVERILREGETIARIRHPHVVDIYDVGIHDGVPYLVEEFLEGETLHDLIDRIGPLSPTQIADVLVPIADALAAAHDATVVHRDLKPANIFLARDTRGHVWPKLLDFGISKVSDRTEGPSLTKAGSVIGTPEYMAPEQIHQLPDVDGRADQYALGVVMYECITGTVPYQHSSLFELLSAAVAGAFNPPHVHRPNLDADFELVVLRAMATDRSRRFSDMHEFARELLPFASAKVQNQFDSSGALVPIDGSSHVDISLPERPSGKVPKNLSHAATLPATPAYIENAHTIRATQAASGIRARSRAPVYGLGVAITTAIVAFGFFAFQVEERPSASQSMFDVDVTARPSDAAIRLDGRTIGTGDAHLALPRDGSEHVLEVRAAGHATREILFRDSFSPLVVTLDPVTTTSAATAPIEEPVEETGDQATDTSARASRMRTKRTSSPTTTSAPSDALDIRLAR